MLLNIFQAGVRISATFGKFADRPFHVFLFPIHPDAASALAAARPDLHSILEARIDQTRRGGCWRSAGSGIFLLRVGRAFRAMLAAGHVEWLEHWPALIPFPSLQRIFRFFLFQEDSHKAAIAVVRSSEPGQALRAAFNVGQ